MTMRELGFYTALLITLTAWASGAWLHLEHISVLGGNILYGVTVSAFLSAGVLAYRDIREDLDLTPAQRAERDARLQASAQRDADGYQPKHRR